MRMLRWFAAHVAGRVAMLDDGAQAFVDAGSFMLQRRGVARSAQLAACHLLLSALSATTAVDLARTGAFISALMVVLVSVFWFVNGAFLYWREREREALAVALPVRRYAFSRAIGWWLLLQSLFGAWALGLDARQLGSAVVLFVLVHLISTPGKPPPRRERRPVLVPSEAV